MAEPTLKPAQHHLRERLTWAAAGLVALALHLAWFGLIDIPTTTAPVAIAPVVSLQLLDRQEVEEYLSTFSPGTFALPSLQGFSQTIFANTISLRSPIQPVAESALLLDREQIRDLRKPFAGEVPSWTDARPRLDKFDLAALSTEPVGVTWAAAMEWIPTVHVLNPTPKRPAESLGIDSPVQGWGPTPWVAELQLAINADGLVRQVVLHRRTASAVLNTWLVRQAYGWRWPAQSDPQGAMAHIDVVIRYGPQRAAATGEGT